MTGYEVVWVNGTRCIVTSSGWVLPIVAGGADEQEEGREESGQEGGEGGQEEDEGEEGGEEGREEETIRDPAKRLAAVDEANARLSKKLKDKDKALKERDAQIRKFEDEKKTDDQKLTERAEGAERRIKELETEIGGLKAERMVLTHEKLAKLSPKRRELLMPAIMKDLEVDEDGDSNLDELVAGIEKGDASLLKPPDEDEQEEETPTGTRPVKAPKKGQGPDQASLVKRFPAIARGRSA